ASSIATTRVGWLGAGLPRVGSDAGRNLCHHAIGRRVGRWRLGFRKGPRWRRRRQRLFRDRQWLRQIARTWARVSLSYGLGRRRATASRLQANMRLAIGPRLTTAIRIWARVVHSWRQVVGSLAGARR